MILLSIIIPTIGRRSQLFELLQSIYSMKNISYEFEVIVIDQNPTGYLDETFANFVKYKNFSIYKPKTIGLSHAKNYGCSIANGDFVTFPDDDCMLYPDTYEYAMNTIVNFKLDLVSGKCVDNFGQDSVTKFKKEEYYLNLNTMNGGFVEATCVIRKSIFDKYQFDEKLGAGTFFGAHEGFDWLYRILKNEKYAIYFSPKILFYHPQVLIEKGNYSSLKRINSYSYGFIYSRYKNHLYLETYIRIFLVFCFSFCLIFYDFRKAKYYFVEFFSLLNGILFYKSLNH